MGHEQVEEAVAVHVAHRNAHVRFRLSHRVESDTARESLLLENAVLLINPQVIGFAIVGHEDVRPTIAIEVGAQHAERRTTRAFKPRRSGYVLKANPWRLAAVGTTEVVIKVSGDAGKAPGMAKIECAVKESARHRGIVSDVVDNNEIEPAVAVVIHEGGRGSPARILQASLMRDIGERAVAVIEE